MRLSGGGQFLRLLNKSKAKKLKSSENNLIYSFTLAEVLITVGIIGIVAALTIPPLMQKYNERVTVEKLNKTYVLINQAYKRMVDDYGISSLWDDPNATFNNIFPQYINATRIYDKSCMGGNNIFYSWRLSNVHPTTPNAFSSRWKLPDGTCLAVHYSGSKNCASSENIAKKGPYQRSCGDMMIDINGNSGPNRINIDYFGFSLGNDGIVPFGLKSANVWYDKFSQCLNDQYNYGVCSGWIIMNKNMDYIHCPEKLGWDKKHSCSE